MRRLLIDRRGLALLEFALALPILLTLAAIVVDLGFCYKARLDTLRGVAAGALYAFENGGSVTGTTAEQLRSTVAAVVLQSAGTRLPTVTISINNVAGAGAANDYYCTSGEPLAWRSVGATSTSCGDGTMAAKFITIRTSGNQPSLIPFVSVGARLFPLGETVVVRAK